MQITRWGSAADHGPKEVQIQPRWVAWSPSSKTIEIAAFQVKDFTTSANHDWLIQMSLAEIQNLIDAAASAVGGNDSNAVQIAMAPALTSLLRLATEASKDTVLKPTPTPPSEETLGGSAHPK